MTPSRSACSGFVGIPVDGPARWTSTITSGSSSVIPSPIVSCFSTMPGPLEVETPSEPAEARAERRADGGNLIFRLKCAHAEVLVARKLLENGRCRRDRVRAEEQGQA